MKKRSRRRFVIPFMSLAYLALLLHVFLPHHHHADAVYFGDMSCPTTADHTHDHHPREESHCLDDSECTSITHALLQGKNDRNLFPVFTLNVLASFAVEMVPDEGCRYPLRHPLSDGPPLRCELSTKGLRGPPEIS